MISWAMGQEYSRKCFAWRYTIHPAWCAGECWFSPDWCSSHIILYTVYMWLFFCCSYWTKSSEEESAWIMLFSMGFVSCLLFLLGNPKPKFRKDMKEEDNPSMKVDHLITTSCSFFVCHHLSFSRQFEGWQGMLWKSYKLTWKGLEVPIF